MEKIIGCFSNFVILTLIVLTTEGLAYFGSEGMDYSDSDAQQFALQRQRGNEIEKDGRYQVKEGAILNVSCTAMDANPAARLSFQGFTEDQFVNIEKNGTAKYTLTTISTLSSLTISHRHDRLTCIISHPAYSTGEESITLNLDVIYPPPAIEQFNIKQQSNGSIDGETIYTAYAHEEVTFTCQTVSGEAQGNPEPKLTLLVLKKGDREYRDVDNRRIKSDFKRKIIIFSVRNLDDSGRYLCEAYNSAGTSRAADDQSIRLEIIGVKGQPGETNFKKIFIALFVVALCILAIGTISLVSRKKIKMWLDPEATDHDSVSDNTTVTGITDASRVSKSTRKKAGSRKKKAEGKKVKGVSSGTTVGSVATTLSGASSIATGKSKSPGPKKKNRGGEKQSKKGTSRSALRSGKSNRSSYTSGRTSVTGTTRQSG